MKFDSSHIETNFIKIIFIKQLKIRSGLCLSSLLLLFIVKLVCTINYLYPTKDNK